MARTTVTGAQDARWGGPRNLRDRVIRLARRLRSAGVRVTPGDVVASLQALAAVDLGDPGDVRHALRLTLAHRVEDLPAVDRLLEELLWGERPRGGGDGAPEAVGWYDPDAQAPADGTDVPGEAAAGGPDAGDDSGGAGAAGGPAGEEEAGPSEQEREDPPPDAEAEGVEAVLVAAVGAGDASSAGDEPGEPGDGGAARPEESAPGGGLLGGYSRLAVLTRRDLRDVPPEDQRLLEEVAARIGRILATRVSRRYRRHRTGRIDGRRALREAGRRAGDLVRWPRLRRRVRKPRLVCLLDVSGSMDVYSHVFLRFLHALQHAGGRVETFAFGTRLTRLTPVLRNPRAGEALARAAAVTADWSGGTRIGECLHVFVTRYGSLLDRDTTLIVLSDGLDRGDLDVLDRALRACRQRARSLIWLNPLAGDPRFEPRAQGMQVALPYVDVLAPAHSIESLARLVVLLERTGAHPGVRARPLAGLVAGR